MDLTEAVMLVVFDIRKSDAEFSAHQAIDSALNVNRSDVVHTGGDLETAYLMVLDHADRPDELEQAIHEYGSRVVSTRSSGRLSPMAQDVIMHAKDHGDGMWSIDADRALFQELVRHGLAVETINGGHRVLTARGMHARYLIPIL